MDTPAVPLLTLSSHITHHTNHNPQSSWGEASNRATYSRSCPRPSPKASQTWCSTGFGVGTVVRVWFGFSHITMPPYLQVAMGTMVSCSNDDCPIEWFHLACVGLTDAVRARLHAFVCAFG